MKIKLKYYAKNSNGEPRFFEKICNSKKELQDFLTFKIKLTSISGSFLD